MFIKQLAKQIPQIPTILTLQILNNFICSVVFMYGMYPNVPCMSIETSLVKMLKACA